MSEGLLFQSKWDIIQQKFIFPRQVLGTSNAWAASEKSQGNTLFESWSTGHVNSFCPIELYLVYFYPSTVARVALQKASKTMSDIEHYQMDSVIYLMKNSNRQRFSLIYFGVVANRVIAWLGYYLDLQFRRRNLIGSYLSTFFVIRSLIPILGNCHIPL